MKKKLIPLSLLSLWKPQKVQYLFVFTLLCYVKSDCQSTFAIKFQNDVLLCE